VGGAGGATASLITGAIAARGAATGAAVIAQQLPAPKHGISEIIGIAKGAHIRSGGQTTELKQVAVKQAGGIHIALRQIGGAQIALAHNGGAQVAVRQMGGKQIEAEQIPRVAGQISSGGQIMADAQRGGQTNALQEVNAQHDIPIQVGGIHKLDKQTGMHIGMEIVMHHKLLVQLQNTPKKMALHTTI
jgi:hypothetical protein